jgi:hypothetical protein
VFVSFRFEVGPRIKNSFHIDVEDISAQFDLYPSINPKGLPNMMPPMVCDIIEKL